MKTIRAKIWVSALRAISNDHGGSLATHKESSMSRIDRLFVVFGLAALGVTSSLVSASVSAQEQSEPATEQTQAAPAPSPGGDENAAAPASGAGDDAADDEFIPTEEIPADEEVTFPVDI
jgi:hypothetical protein